MNTDDERREEFTKNTHNLESNVLINGVIHGEPYSEATQHEDLKKENSIGICLSSNGNFRENFPCIVVGRTKSLKTNLSSDSFYTDEKNSNSEKFGGSIPSGLYNTKRKKSHYTIRRAPGKISHLLIQPKETVSLVTDSPKLFPKDAAISSQNEIQTHLFYFDCKKCKKSKEYIVEQEHSSEHSEKSSNKHFIRTNLDKKENFFYFFNRKKSNVTEQVDGKCFEKAKEEL